MSCKECTAHYQSVLRLINDPKEFKGLIYSETERDVLGIRGLLPPAVRPADFEMKAVMRILKNHHDDLNRYLYLREIQDVNEKLFYRLLMEHTKKLLPYVYFPGIAKACLEYSTIFRRPRGIFITIEDTGSIADILRNYPMKVKAIVVTDGERILGLGDLGANSMGISIGKVTLYTALAGIHPDYLLPVALDVGTDNMKLLTDPLYIGLRRERVFGDPYDELLDEFMDAVTKTYGSNCLVQFEDFGKENAFRLLKKYMSKYCVFNDNIQGTASVVLGGLFACAKITQIELSKQTYLFFGAGEAAVGISTLLIDAMQEDGLSKSEATDRIWMIDSNGLVVKSRDPAMLTSYESFCAKDFEELHDIHKIIESIRPTVLIGTSAQPSAFTKKVLKLMAQINEKPVIFPLSNPTEKSECTAEEAYRFTSGRCIFASGSPFDPVVIDDKEFHPGQANNSYIFPGVALAVIGCRPKTVPKRVFLEAAKSLAGQVSKDQLDVGHVYPSLDNIRQVSMAIAIAVSEYFYNEGIAYQSNNKPDDLKRFLQNSLYDPYLD